MILRYQKRGKLVSMVLRCQNGGERVVWFSVVEGEGGARYGVAEYISNDISEN